MTTKHVNKSLNCRVSSATSKRSWTVLQQQDPADFWRHRESWLDRLAAAALQCGFLDPCLPVHYEWGQVCGQGGVLHCHFSLRDLVSSLCARHHSTRCMGGHPFLHLPAVGPAPQHQGKLSLASLIGSRNVLFKQSVAGSCIRSYLLPPPLPSSQVVQVVPFHFSFPIEIPYKFLIQHTHPTFSVHHILHELVALKICGEKA